MQDEYQAPEIKKMEFDMSRFTTPKTKATSERAELVEQFVTRLNASRVAGGYKKLSPGFYASKMSHIPTDELYFFLKKCQQAKNFSSCWWYFCNPKKGGDK